MRNSEKETDLERCKRLINNILLEYNCAIRTDDYHYAWLEDKDTNETTSIGD